jgi:hypothetical protein
VTLLEKKDIMDFLNLSHHENDSVLIGCRANSLDSYDCCEYDILVLQRDSERKNNGKTKKYELHKINGKTLEIFFLNKEELIYNTDLNFLGYIDLTGSNFKHNSENLFERKKNYSINNSKTLAIRKSVKFALDCTKVHKQLTNGIIDQKLSSLYLKMMSFRVLELFVHLFHDETLSPGHLKYQMNALKEGNIKIKESMDIVLDYLQLDRSNVSTITRSEKSLFFLLNNVMNQGRHHSYQHKEGEILAFKISHFKNKSMYVDANLLIHDFVRKQNFDEGFIKSYSKVLSQILDVQIKEKLILLKEIEVLFNINKSFIKNVY